MARTTISNGDIRDRAITSSKMAQAVAIEDLTANIIRNDSGYTSFLPVGSETPSTINAGSVLISPNPGTDISKVPSPGGSGYFSGDLLIEGNLTVNGEQTVINTATLSVEDNIIVLNSGVTGSNTTSAGIEVERGTYPNAIIRWNEGSDIWDLTTDGGSTYSRIIDQAYGDTRYMAKGNSTFNSHISVTSGTDDILQLYQSGGGLSNISFYSNLSDGVTYSKIGSIGINSTENDLVITAPSRIYFSNNAYVNGNIAIKEGSTVDGVDISNHHGNLIANVKHVTDAQFAALSGTSGTPSSTNKYVTNADSRLTNSRTPTTHGDSLHNHLSYFDTISDDKATQNIRSASAALRSIQFKGGTNIQVQVGSDSSNAGIVTISGVHNHDTLYMKLSSTGTQTIASDLVVGTVEAPKSLIVQGDLTVTGTTTYLNTTHLNVGDNIITLNDDYTGSSPTENAGIEVNRGTLATTSIVWDEANDYWSLTNNGSNYYRIVDLNLADGRYVNITGDTMTGTLETSVASGSGLKVTTGDSSINVLEVNYSGGGYGFDIKYKGTETGNDKALELWADNQNSAAKRAMRIHQDGTITFDQNASMSGSLSVYSNVSVGGNLTITGTINGVDPASDSAKLDPVYNNYQKRKREAVSLLVSVPQDTEVALSTLGFTLDWIESNIVMVIVDGQVNAPGIDYTLGTTNTITFGYDIPVGSIMDIIVL